ncbi:MAG: CBS domain-containing protein [Clostridiales bacterium]|nr:CBS domain-containing protein [Clostridiales bacterium]
MNIAFFMQPKAETAYLYNDYTVRQGLEKMKFHGYSAIPVLDREGHYLGTVSEGDFLWTIVTEDSSQTTIKVEELETIGMDQIELHPEKNPAIRITSSIDELVERALNQNFIPVVDDRDMFIGIVTRRTVIRYFYETNDLPRDKSETLLKLSH